MSLDSSLLLSLLTGDPAQRDAQVSKLLAQRVGGDGSGPDLSALFTPAPEPAAAPEPSAATSALYREVQLLDEELRRVAAIVAAVGAALGACPRCLGTDDVCTVCGGAGVAGASDPDRDRFAALIAPAVVRLADEEGAVDTS
jgi:hypothetical protein